MRFLEKKGRFRLISEATLEKKEPVMAVGVLEYIVSTQAAGRNVLLTYKCDVAVAVAVIALENAVSNLPAAAREDAAYTAVVCSVWREERKEREEKREEEGAG